MKLRVDCIVESDEKPPLSEEGNLKIRQETSLLSGNGKVLDSSNTESLIAELFSLRKKYDAVVEYTVHLTAEKDMLVSQLSELQKELNREKQRKKLDNLKELNSESIEKSHPKPNPLLVSLSKDTDLAHLA
jgi:hypothetical protein